MTLATYNVLISPWISIEMLSGEQQIMGLRDVILRAHEIRRIIDSSPLMEYGIQRLLIVLLMDMLQPQYIEDIEDVLRSGQFCREQLDDYIAMCERDGPCFDLFDERKPFLQSARNERWDPSGSEKPVALLIHELPSGNNHIHFDHRLQEDQALSPAVCAKALCAVNLFCYGNRFYSSSINGSPPIYILVQGETLFETLVYNMIASSGVSMPYDDPPPFWRCKIEVEPKKVVESTSLLYGLTWPARRVLLIPDESGGFCAQTGQKCLTIVRKIVFQTGSQFGEFSYWRDPYVPYSHNKEGKFSIKPMIGREIWIKSI